MITVEFELGHSLDEAANDVRSRVARATRNLPPDIEEPVVEKAEADAQPVVFLRLDAPNRTILDLTEIADTLVRQRLQTIQGVSNVSIYGEQIYAIRIDLRPDALAARGLTVTDVPGSSAFDIVMDCAGPLSHVPASSGYVELTKSGEAAYTDHSRPVYLVDAGSIKHIETSLGTGDGFVRGLRHYGYRDLTGHSIVIFGAGKVGSGVAVRAAAEGARVTLIDSRSPVAADQFTRLSADDESAIRQAVSTAWCIVSATGVEGALHRFAPDLCASSAVLANMGAFDEFGPEVPIERVLNGKIPVNFVLDEPTRLRYIDPSLALAVAGAVELAAGRLHPGINVPTRAVERQVLEPARRHGDIRQELAAVGI